MKTLLVLFAVLLFCQIAAREAEAQSQPNVLYIFTDDQSHRTVSCYPEAYEWAKTPNIDRIARDGVRFTHAYIGSYFVDLFPTPKGADER